MKDYLLLIFTFMCILCYQSHQIRILIAGLGMAWNRDGLSCAKARHTHFFLVEPLELEIDGYWL